MTNGRYSRYSYLRCIAFHTWSRIFIICWAREHQRQMFVASTSGWSCVHALHFRQPSLFRAAPDIILLLAPARKTHGGRVGQEQIATTDTLADHHHRHHQPSIEWRWGGDQGPAWVMASFCIIMYCISFNPVGRGHIMTWYVFHAC